jgi:hypothetical protein
MIKYKCQTSTLTTSLSLDYKAVSAITAFEWDTHLSTPGNFAVYEKLIYAAKLAMGHLGSEAIPPDRVLVDNFLARIRGLRFQELPQNANYNDLLRKATSVTEIARLKAIIEEFRLKNQLGPLDPLLESTTLLSSSAPSAEGTVVTPPDGATFASQVSLSFEDAVAVLRSKLPAADFDSYFEMTPSRTLLLRLVPDGSRCISINSSEHGFGEQHRHAYRVVRKVTEERRSKEIRRAKQHLDGTTSGGKVSISKTPSASKSRPVASSSDISSNKSPKRPEKGNSDRAPSTKEKSSDFPSGCEF